MMKISWRLGSWMLVATILSGCGGDSGSKPHAEKKLDTTTRQASPALAMNDDETPETGGVVPTSAIGEPSQKSDVDEDETRIAAPEKNSPEWFILQITRLKLRPLGDEVDAFSQSPDKQAELRRERNEQLVNLATEAIARTHKNKTEAGQRVFDLAVHHLLEAELQLALTGDKEHIDAIYEHASSLYERDPKSKAAIEAGQVLISFARLNAQRFGQQEPKWLEEYGRLARQFAKSFPQEERQAIPILLAAGQSCEFHGLTTDAIQSYATIQEQFPENPAVDRVTAILRRLNLKGRPIELAGPTLGGGYVNAAEMTGKPMLVVFWTTQAQPFVRQLPHLRELLGQINSERLNVVSVNLDDDDNESAVQTFLETNGLNWQTIFQTDAEKRGWNNPVATYYGIQSVPLFWVVSAKGTVVDASNNVQQIEPLLRKLMISRQTPQSEQK